jgi:hypothetical protein
VIHKVSGDRAREAADMERLRPSHCYTDALFIGEKTALLALLESCTLAGKTVTEY